MLGLYTRDLHSSVIDQPVLEDNEPEMSETRRVDFTEHNTGTEASASPFRTKSMQSETEKITVSVKSKGSSLFTSYNSTLKNLQVSVQSHSDFSSDMRKNIRKEKSNLRKLRKFADISMVFLFLWILGLLVSSYLLTFNLEEFSEDMDTIMDLGLQLDLPIQASLRSRELLSHDPLAPGYLADLSEAFQLHFGHLQGQSSIPRTEHLATPGLWWDFDGKDFTPTPTNALGLMSKMATHISLLSQRWLINDTDTDFLCVYRNGAGETLSAFNKTMRKVLQAMNEATTGNENTLKILSTAGAVVFFVVCLSVNILIWRKMRYLRKIVWRVLKNLSIFIYLAARSNSKTRLETTHGLDYDEMQAEHPEPSSRNKRMQLKRVAALPESKLLFVSLLVFSGVFSYVVINYFTDTISDASVYHQQLPSLIYYSAVRTSELSKVFFYLRESTSNATYFSILHKDFPLYDIQTHFQAALASLSYFEQSLLYSTTELNVHTLKVSSAHSAVILGETAPAAPFLKYGVHATLSAMVLDLMTVNLTDPGAVSLWQDRKETMHEALDNLTLFYKVDVEADIAGMNREHMVLMAVICVSMLGYYLVGIRYLTTRIMEDVGAEWMILSYIPREACTEAIDLLRKG